MPAEDDGFIRPNETKRTRTVFYTEYDYDDIPLSPAESNVTDNLEDNVTPPVITPHTSNESSNTGSVTSLQLVQSEDDLLIPLYLFHVIERTSLNIEFNRCLQLSLSHGTEEYDNPADDDGDDVGSSSSYETVDDEENETDEKVDEINFFTHGEADNIPVIQIDPAAFDMLIHNINTYMQENNDPYRLMELVHRYLYEADGEIVFGEPEEFTPEYMFGGRDRDRIIPSYLFEEPDSETIIPLYMFDEPEDYGPIIPQYMFEEPEEIVVPVAPFLVEDEDDDNTTYSAGDDNNTQPDQVQHENIVDLLAGGDFMDIDDVIPYLSDK